MIEVYFGSMEKRNCLILCKVGRKRLSKVFNLQKKCTFSVCFISYGKLNIYFRNQHRNNRFSMLPKCDLHESTYKFDDFYENMIVGFLGQFPNQVLSKMEKYNYVKNIKCHSRFLIQRKDTDSNCIYFLD